jgi:serine/threonine-protein kinase
MDGNDELTEEGPLAALSAIELADLLLSAAVQRQVVSISLVPGVTSYELGIELAGEGPSPTRVPAPQASAAAARVALVAGIDLATALDQLGRVRVEAAGIEREILVLAALRPAGLMVELRRLVSPAESGKQRSVAVEGGQYPFRVGQYLLDEELGRGGHGVVYRAQHEVLEKIVAVKLLDASSASNPKMVTMFVREGRLAARVDSPGIVSVTDFGTTEDGRPFLVMELVPWPTLDVLVKAAGALPVLRSVTIARAVLVALESAHQQGVVHSDLKPSNIFVSEQDQIKLGDFGIARMANEIGADTLMPANMVFGTPLYMSPEQARGFASDRRSDIYALGCVLYEMLAGRPPFDGENPTEVLVHHVQSPVPPVVSPHAPVPPLLAETVQRALAKRPERRYQSASEMIADLDRCTAVLSRTGWQKWLAP